MLTMFYNKMRSIVEFAKRSGTLRRGALSFNPSFWFCKDSQKNSQRVEAYQDWEYCKMIAGELKSARINTALTLLFQSHLNHKILDIQIYNSVLQAVQDASMDCTYSEIVYLLYRQHFPPHLLLLNSMGKLVSTTSQHLLSLLKQDYQTINHPFPTPKKSRRQSRAEKQAAIRQVDTQPSKQKPKEFSRRVESEAIKPISIDLKDLGGESGFGGEKGIEESIKMKLSAELKHALEQLNSEMPFSKINLFDVQIEINPSEREIEPHEEFEYEQDHDEGMQEGGGVGLFELDISKIKIGRVQFVCNNPHEKNKDS